MPRKRALLSLVAVCTALSTAIEAANLTGNWYDGIPSIRVFYPGQDVGSYAIAVNTEMQTAQFSDKRFAILLTRGNYAGAELPVAYYTSLVGVGDEASDVVVSSFYSLDNPRVGNACDNFWRTAEGLTTTKASITWAASQASPLRRVHVQSELWLSENGAPHWSSGGFIGESIVDGPLNMGTQQQFLVRNSRLARGAVGKSKNYVFVGTQGAPASSPDGTISVVPATARVAPKPYLVERGGRWSIAVPSVRMGIAGLIPSRHRLIDFSRVYLAKEGDTAATINAGIASKDALLLTPGIYGLDYEINVNKRGFVILGIGFPTLVALHGKQAIYIGAQAVNARVASVLLEAGTPVTSAATMPMLTWVGSGGVASDIFTRVGAFRYQRSFKPTCLQTRADTHIQIEGSGVTMDNVWIWHADHDDCGGASDRSYSRFGLVVRGDDVAVYGLEAEHTFDNIVQWYGENGQVYLFQSELPYHVASYPGTGAYMVAPNVRRHAGVGMGVYMVGSYTVDTGFSVPATAHMTNAFIWCITGANTQFRSVLCASGRCYYGDRCDHSSCYVYHLGTGLNSSEVILV